MQEYNKHIDYNLISKYLAGEASSNEMNAVEAWRNENNENRREFERLALIWEETTYPETPETGAVDTDAAWMLLQKRIKASNKAPGSYPGRSSKERTLFYYAARIAAVMVIGLMVYNMYKWQLGTPVEQELITTGTVKEAKLPDETAITLNENSKITYPEKFVSQSREVKLTGEAFFEVKKEAEKPFIVHVDKAHIKVLGTSFNVRAMEEEKDISVTVQEGRVRLSDEDDIAFVILEPNEKGILDKESGNIEKYSRTDGSDLFWKTKTLIFRDTRLDTVFETLERVYEVDIQEANDQIKNCELTGKFQDVTVDEILDNIALNFNLTIIKQNRTYTIKGDGC